MSTVMYGCLDETGALEYLAGRGDRDAVMEHLEGCPRCRELVLEIARAQTGEISGSAATAGAPVSTPGADTKARQRVGRFEIVSELGAGAMGVVYRAEDADLRRPVAIKVMRGDMGGDAGRKRMLREAQAMAQLDHPNVIRVYEVGTETGGDVFIAMEYVDGATLSKWLRAQPRDSRAIVDAFVMAARGLAAAHAVGVIHRDFKPDNAMVDRQGRVKVGDFGLARAIGQSDSDAQHAGSPLGVTMTQTGALLGTPLYMSPEQLDGNAADARSDQFALCVAMYEALYGERPFPGANLVELREARDRGPRLPRTKRGTAALWPILRRGMDRVPANRFASMDELLAAIERVPRAKRRRALIAVGTAAAIVAGGGAAWLALRPSAPATCEEGNLARCAEIAMHERSAARPDLVAEFRAQLSACDHGGHDACAEVANMYELGRGVAPNPERALSLAKDACAHDSALACRYAGDFQTGTDLKAVIAAWSRACELGSAHACGDLAKYRAQGIGGPPDSAAAKTLGDRHLKLAHEGCERGDQDSCYTLATAIASDDPARSALLAETACLHGFPDACSGAAHDYLTGKGVQVDLAHATELYERACAHRLGEAYVEYAFELVVGDLGKPDPVRAVAMARDACDHLGEVNCVGLATFYMRGFGVPQDPALAASLFERACNAGLPLACAVAGDDALASVVNASKRTRLLTRACELGEAQGCANLGQVAWKAGDFPEAYSKFQRGCQLSESKLGCSGVAELMFTGQGTARDPEGARALLDRSCHAGDHQSCRKLGDRLRDGKDVPRSPVDALDAYDRACQMSNGLACRSAAAMLEDASSGLTPDPERAEKYRKRGCAQRPDECGKK
jgi:TPR repeat protein/predicted Ser/Thr protein kinase